MLLIPFLVLLIQLLVLLTSVWSIQSVLYSLRIMTPSNFALESSPDHAEAPDHAPDHAPADAPDHAPDAYDSYLSCS